MGRTTTMQCFPELTAVINLFNLILSCFGIPLILYVDNLHDDELKMFILMNII